MQHKYTLHVVCIALTIDLWCWSRAELFTAMSDMETLLETHKKIIDDLTDYIQKEEKRLEFLKKQLDAYRREHEMATADVPNYLGNPINAYTLIKRLTTDLDFIENRIKLGTEFVGKVNNSDVKYPTGEDLTGAVQALTRLQNTYHLDIGELAEGRLNGVVYNAIRHQAVSTPLSAGDCYEAGRTLYEIGDHRNSLRWMEEALRKYKQEDQLYYFSEVDILDLMNYLRYLLDGSQIASMWADNIIRLDPDQERGPNKVKYQENLAENKEMFQLNYREIIDDNETSNEGENKVYEALCRGEMDVPSQISRKLKCSYLSANHAFLTIAPIKSEQVYSQPDVFVYHQVLSDAEIQRIQALARPRFERATVTDMFGKSIAAENRISKLAWLRDEHSPVLARVSRRVADFTGLCMDYAEPLQVVNYGIGGHYDVHYDFFSRKSNISYNSNVGNRIATVLFYMSDVAQGGATVFTELGLSVFPVKNAALVWRNLHPSGEGDIATRHAACPVLRGSKWAANKWIRQRGQELLAPCNLEYQKENVMRKIIKAEPRARV